MQHQKAWLTLVELFHQVLQALLTHLLCGDGRPIDEGQTTPVARHHALVFEAIEQGRHTVTLDSNFALGHLRLGQAYLGKKQYELGIAEFKKVATLTGNGSPSLVNLGRAYAAAGRRADAQKSLDQLIELSKTTYVPAADMGWMFAALGQKDKAFEWLEKSYDEHSLLLVWVKVIPDFDTLRSDPRFADLLRRMNLQP